MKEVPGWGSDQEDDEPQWRRWTAEEAKALRERQPSISPWRVVGAQVLAGLLCVALGWLITRRGSVAVSALYGALATVVPSTLLARGMTRRNANAVSAAAGFLFWEMLKIGVAVAMLLLAPKIVPQLSWPALLATMLVCIKVNWLALLWTRKPGAAAGRPAH